MTSLICLTISRGVCGGASRPNQPTELVTGHRFGHGRDVRIEFGSYGIGDTQCLELTRLHELLHHRPRSKHHVDTAAEQIGHGRTGSLVGNVQHLDPGITRKQQPRKVRCGADARRTECQSFRLLFRIPDQIGNRVGRQCWADNEQVRRRRGDDDWREHLVDVERTIRIDAAGYRHQRASGCHQQGVAIRLRFHDGPSPDRPRCAGLIFHDDGLAPFVVQILRDDARQHIRAATGGKRNDHLYRVVGIVGG